MLLISTLANSLIFGQGKAIQNTKVPSFDSVKIYSLDPTKCKSNKMEVVNDGKLNDCFKLSKILSKNDVGELIKIIDDTATYGMPPLSCSTKEIGAIFYNKGKITGFITFSFECDNLKSSFIIPANEKYKINAGEEGYYIYSCFSNSGKRKLVEYFKQIGLSINTDLREESPKK